MGFGQPLFGPLSDDIGRKPAICAGLALFMAGCVVSFLTPTFEGMLAVRVLQGIGIAAPRNVSVAMVRDRYEGRRMARIMSFVMAVFIVLPMLAPAIGQGILLIADWRAIFLSLFAFTAIVGIWFVLRQPETLPAERRARFSTRALGRAELVVLKSRQWSDTPWPRASSSLPSSPI